MTSWLIDVLLLSALAFTAWRTGTMLRELRRLKAENSSFRQMLAEADAAIDRAAYAVVTFKGEGMRTLAELEEKTAEARRQTERLDFAIRSADLQLTLAERSTMRAAEAA